MASPLSGSWLARTTKKIRVLAREPVTQGEYTDDELRELFIEPAMETVFNSLAKSTTKMVLSVLTYTLTKNRQYYKLPPHARKVIRVGRFNDHGYVTQDILPRSEYNAQGPAWRLDGGSLELRPWPRDVDAYAEDGKIDVWYVPGGNIRLLQGTTSAGYQDTNVWRAQTSPDFGEFQTDENAYVGCSLRLFGNSEQDFESPIQEVDTSTGDLTLRYDLPSAYNGASDIKYEILPPMPYSVWNPIALVAVKELMAVNDNPGKYQLIERQVADAVKTIRDGVTTAQGRVPTRFERDTWLGRDLLFTGFASS